MGFEIVTRQAMVMQFILEMAKNVKRHPSEIYTAFFNKYRLSKKTKIGREFHEAFDEELELFRERTKEKAILRDKDKTEEQLKEEEGERLEEERAKNRKEESDRERRMEMSPSGM